MYFFAVLPAKKKDKILLDEEKKTDAHTRESIFRAILSERDLRHTHPTHSSRAFFRNTRKRRTKTGHEEIAEPRSVSVLLLLLLRLVLLAFRVFCRQKR